MAKGREISLIDINKNFDTEDKCIAYLEHTRWGDTPTCARCGCCDVKRHKTQKHQWYCRGCQKNFNVKIGTMFQKTKVSLESWFIVITQMLLIKKGISSHSVARMINVEVNTAWRMTNKIREAMAKDIFVEKLVGTIECDEAYIGGLSKWRKTKPDENGEFKKNKRGVGTEHQVCVWGAVQRAEDGKVKRARVVIHPSKQLHFKDLKKLVDDNVDISKSRLMTDGLLGYRKFNKLMEHQYSQHNTGWYVNQEDYNVHTNNIESLWRCIKANINGCRHWVSLKHMQKYVDEQVYRFNTKDLGTAFAFDNVLKMAVG
jgi:transposase-like protein